MIVAGVAGRNALQDQNTNVYGGFANFAFALRSMYECCTAAFFVVGLDTPAGPCGNSYEGCEPENRQYQIDNSKHVGISKLLRLLI